MRLRLKKTIKYAEEEKEVKEKENKERAVKSLGYRGRKDRVTHRRYRNQAYRQTHQYETRRPPPGKQAFRSGGDQRYSKRVYLGAQHRRFSGCPPPVCQFRMSRTARSVLWRVRQHPPKRNLEGGQALNQLDRTSFPPMRTRLRQP